MGCDLINKMSGIWRNGFNPRTHMGCDLALNESIFYEIRFNPRTHMGCDNIFVVGPLALDVSIHAPTWGATQSIFGSSLGA